MPVREIYGLSVERETEGEKEREEQGRGRDAVMHSKILNECRKNRDMTLV